MTAQSIAARRMKRECRNIAIRESTPLARIGSAAGTVRARGLIQKFDSPHILILRLRILSLRRLGGVFAGRSPRSLTGDSEMADKRFDVGPSKSNGERARIRAEFKFDRSIVLF